MDSLLRTDTVATTLPVHRAGLAQMVEHLICNQGVAGSIPAAGTTPRLRAQRAAEMSFRTGMFHCRPFPC